MPLYLKSIGMGAVYIGVLEGIADAIAGVSKSYFGKLSDVSGRRMPFVWFGYVLSSFSKAAIGLFIHPAWVLFTRSADRLGKGIRTAPRDAMLSAEATPETKGQVFGFHRSLDTLGAFIGPILALVYLNFHPGEYRRLFMYALIPAAFVVSARLGIAGLAVGSVDDAGRARGNGHEADFAAPARPLRLSPGADC